MGQSGRWKTLGNTAEPNWGKQDKESKTKYNTHTQDKREAK